MGGIERVAVFCGSSAGSDPGFARAASALGAALARGGIGLVYGGGAVGLMGVLADAVVAGGGEVQGVITEALLGREVGHPDVSELHIVRTMHERKAKMADLADAFVMMPGGFGTLEEFFEVLTWTQLGIHTKPCAVFDPLGYFVPLFVLVDSAVEEGFVLPEHKELLIRSDTPEGILAALRSWTPPPVDKWMGRSER